MQNSFFADSGSVNSSSVNSFDEKDFQLPDLEIDNGANWESIQQEKTLRKKLADLQSQLNKERRIYCRLDTIKNIPKEKLSKKKGIIDSESEMNLKRADIHARGQITAIKYAIQRPPGDLKEDIEIYKSILDGSFTGDDEDFMESTVDHPKLNSVEEKLEDLRQDENEKWCGKHGKKMNEKYTNREKRLLRKWFQAMDYDGSGEVNVEELQDPMLSSGILKTREQVVRVLANVDKNHTMGIDFEEFLLALHSNKLADQKKLKKLQRMSADPYFDTDTLITAERRNKLIKSILKRCENRQNEIDKLYKKYDKAKLTKKDREAFDYELEKLEEEQTRSVYLHMKYIHALDGVIQEKNNFYSEQQKIQEYEWEDRMTRLNRDEFYKNITNVRMSSSNRGEALEILKSTVPLRQLHSSSYDATQESSIADISSVESLAESFNTFHTPHLNSTYLDALRPYQEKEDVRSTLYKVYAPVSPKKDFRKPKKTKPISYF